MHERFLLPELRFSAGSVGLCKLVMRSDHFPGENTIQLLSSKRVTVIGMIAYLCGCQLIIAVSVCCLRWYLCIMNAIVILVK